MTRESFQNSNFASTLRRNRLSLVKSYFFYFHASELVALTTKASEAWWKWAGVPRPPSSRGQCQVTSTPCVLFEWGLKISFWGSPKPAPLIQRKTRLLSLGARHPVQTHQLDTKAFQRPACSCIPSPQTHHPAFPASTPLWVFVLFLFKFFFFFFFWRGPFLKSLLNMLQHCFCLLSFGFLAMRHGVP